MLHERWSYYIFCIINYGTKLNDCHHLNTWWVVVCNYFYWQQFDMFKKTKILEIPLNNVVNRKGNEFLRRNHYHLDYLIISIRSKKVWVVINNLVENSQMVKTYDVWEESKIPSLPTRLISVIPPGAGNIRIHSIIKQD